MNQENLILYNFKACMRPLFRLAGVFGINLRQAASLRHVPRYVGQYFHFRKMGGRASGYQLILSDYDDQAGSASGHYFHQDLLVASLINRKNPVRHIDIGSRIDGFVAHVAAFRRIEVMDVRQLNSTGHANISFIQADLMNQTISQREITDSISCLHAIEHFGLGRYGDPIDPKGHEKGFRNILGMLKVGGTLYISFPIGQENQVVFNAHRIFHPEDIFNWVDDPSVLSLKRFDYVDDTGDLHLDVDIKKMPTNLSYGCGIYTFNKIR